MISQRRLYIDLLIQLGGALLATILAWTDPLRAALVVLLVLVGWQLLSSIQLVVSFGITGRRRLMVASVAGCLFGILGGSTFGVIAWLPLATVALAHFVRTAEDYAVVSRRPRRFWDL